MSFPGQPWVSCLMVTQASRWRDGVPVGAQSYLAQTFPARELVVVTQDPCPAMIDWALRHGASMFIGDPRLKLGGLRQMAVDMAAGEFVATWDDDDLSDELRLAVQLQALRALPLADACILLRVEILDTVNRRTFVGPMHSWEMTMVARREAMPRYLGHLSEGEDTDVLRRMHQVVVLDRPELFTHVVHEGSVVGKRLAGEWYAAATGGAL